MQAEAEIACPVSSTTVLHQARRANLGIIYMLWSALDPTDLPPPTFPPPASPFVPAELTQGPSSQNSDCQTAGGEFSEAGKGVAKPRFDQSISVMERYEVSEIRRLLCWANYNMTEALQVCELCSARESHEQAGSRHGTILSMFKPSFLACGPPSSGVRRTCFT